MEHGHVVDCSVAAAELDAEHRPAAQRIWGSDAQCSTCSASPPQALFGQLLIGLINGSFYAMLSLGLAVIFGLLQRHQLRPRRAVHDGRLRRLAAAAAISASATGRRWSWRRSSSACSAWLIERLLLQRIYKLDHLYGLLLTFGLALMHRGPVPLAIRLVRPALPDAPSSAGGVNLGFMFLPNYRGLGGRCARGVCLATWFVIETHQARRLPARGDREPGAGPGLRHQRAAADHAHLRLGRRRSRPSPACWPRRSIRCQPADGHRPDHRRVRGRGHRRHGLDPGRRSSPASCSA